MSLKNILWVFLPLLLLLGACTQESEPHSEDEHVHHGTGGTLELPEFQAIELNGRKLKVVATTSIIGDVVEHVGGEAIDLVVLIDPDQDTHSYEPTPQDFVALEEADVIFLNGWHLEEQLAEAVEASFAEKEVAISAEITPLQLANGSTDPHVWFDIHNVEQWSNNTAQILSQLDPANETIYTENLAGYLGRLEFLEQAVDHKLTELPAEKRKLVTNHAAFNYFAEEYDFEVVGTVIPSFSSSAEPAASDLADLVMAMEREGVCTLFAETTQNNDLAGVISAEISHCDQVQVLSLYTESIPDGEALYVGDEDKFGYIGMIHANVETIVEGLR